MRERGLEDTVCLFFEAGRAALPQPLPLRSSYIPLFLRSWPPYIPPVPRLLAPKPSSSGWGPGSSSDLWLLLRLLVVLVLCVSCSGPGPWSCSSLNFCSSSRFRPPSSVPSVGQIARPCQPMALVARPY